MKSPDSEAKLKISPHLLLGSLGTNIYLGLLKLLLPVSNLRPIFFLVGRVSVIQLSTHSPTINTTRQGRLKQMSQLPKDLFSSTYFVLFTLAILFTTFLCRSWKILPLALAKPHPNFKPIQILTSKKHCQASLPDSKDFSNEPPPAPQPSNLPDTLCWCIYLHPAGFG